jgi:SsrA-binding protein
MPRMDSQRAAGTTGGKPIVENRRARFEYEIEDRVEAGLVLEGWEVKSLRAGRAQIVDGYGLVRNGRAWLLGALITPLPSASTHVEADPTRTRPLLLHRREIARLQGLTERRGYTLVPLRLYWKRGRAKVEIGVAKGRKLHDRRNRERDRDWERQRERLLKRRS